MCISHKKHTFLRSANHVTAPRGLSLVNYPMSGLTVTPRGTLSRGLLTNERLFVFLFVLFFTYVFIHVFFTLARLPSAILNIGFAEICTPISKLSFVAISNSKILKPKELTSQVSILLRLILLVSENRKYFEIFVNTHRWWREHGDGSGLTKFAPRFQSFRLWPSLTLKF